VTPAAAPAPARQMSLAADVVRRDTREPRRDARTSARRQPIGCSDGDRPTLEQHVSRVWEGLLAAGVADCPVCGAEMRREGDAGQCGGCGTVLT
jgi:hypothetical protein